MTEASMKALENLRTINSFEWYVVPLLALVIYVWLIIVAYVAAFLFIVWYHDRFSLRGKFVGTAVTVIAAIVCYSVFAIGLGWV